MTKQLLGQRHYDLMQLAMSLKQQLNKNKIELGIVLLGLQDLHAECEYEGIEDFGTFESNLAEIHLNKRRSLQMLRNAKFILEEGIMPDDYMYWDSSVVDEIRRNKKHLQSYRDSVVADVSYSDLFL